MSDYQTKLFDSSRQLADTLVREIDVNQSRYDEMFAVARKDIYPYSMRAARVLQLCTTSCPGLARVHIPEMVNTLDTLKTDGVKRAYLGMLLDVWEHIDEEQIGILTDLCFHWITDMKEAIATRAYALEILLKVTDRYPEISRELLETLENTEGEVTGGIKVRYDRAIRSLRKLNV